jgi:hypothetical protein
MERIFIASRKKENPIILAEPFAPQAGSEKTLPVSLAFQIGEK